VDIQKCPVAVLKVEGGVCGEEEYLKCTVCGVDDTQQCAMSSRMIAERVAKQVYEERADTDAYKNAHHMAKALVTMLVRVEQGKKPMDPIAVFIMGAIAGVAFLGIVGHFKGW
jgi:hypothetical protein